MPPLTEATFSGSGPFVMPLLAKFGGVQIALDRSHLIAEFQFEDGARIHIPIDIQAALAFANAAQTVPHVFAAQVKDLPKS
jgi:hypothetical protein